MNKIPERWINYSSFGKPIEGTRFLPFKVPLKTGMCKRANIEDKKFTPECLLKQFPKLGMIIDLTNTSRYYNPQEFTNQGVNHVKILCEGRKIPDTHVVQKFYNVVDLYLKDSAEDYLIGVHCTHGLHRTSYLICSYMIQRLEIPPEDAIKAFEEARGHRIERQNFVDHLIENGGGGIKIQRYNENSHIPRHVYNQTNRNQNSRTRNYPSTSYYRNENNFQTPNYLNHRRYNNYPENPPYRTFKGDSYRPMNMDSHTRYEEHHYKPSHRPWYQRPTNNYQWRSEMKGGEIRRKEQEQRPRSRRNNYEEDKNSKYIYRREK